MAISNHPGLTLVTGGAWSGKSLFAERHWSEIEDVIHIGTALRTDPLLDTHIQMLMTARPKSWIHIDQPFHVAETLKQYQDQDVSIFIDSASQMISNIAIQSSSKYAPDQMFDHLTASAELLLDSLAGRPRNSKLMVVTAETGWSLAPDNPLQWAVRRTIGIMNQHLASMANAVYVSVCGIETKVK